MGCAALAGGISGILFWALSYMFRRLDRESGLPPPSYLWTAAAIIQPCAAVLSGAGLLESAMLFSYLTFSAYTDKNTTYLYTAVNWAYLSVGLVFLSAAGFRNQCFPAVTMAIGLYMLWVLLCYLLHAISDGDVEMLAAAAVWILAAAIPALSEDLKNSSLILLSLPMAVYTAGGFLAFACNAAAYKRNRKKRAAFAPYILGGSCMVLLGVCLYIKIFH